MLDSLINSDIGTLRMIAEFLKDYPNAVPIVVFYFVYKIINKVIEKSPTTANTVENLAKDALSVGVSFIPGLSAIAKIFKK